MQDNDWMFPRHLHTDELEGAEEEPVSQNLRVDPQMLRQRILRKRPLAQHPRTAAEPLFDIDRSIAGSLPGFSDPMWTLGDAARWVIERTPEAVNGLSIDEDKLVEILPEIHRALASGEVSSFAHTNYNPIPCELPAETWSVYELAIEVKNGLVRIFPVCSSSSDHEQHLLDLKLRREDVLGTWPSHSSVRPPVQPSTTGAENRCRRWLVEMMRKAPNQPRPKASAREEALAQFQGLGKNGFNRAWNAAVRETGAWSWRAPGRRS